MRLLRDPRDTAAHPGSGKGAHAHLHGRFAAGGKLLAGMALPALLMAGCSDSGTGGAPSPPASRSSSMRTVPMTVVSQGGQTLAFVPVTIGGHGPYQFILDTGASTSVVDEGVVSALHLARTGAKESVQGVVGQAKVPLVRIPDWKVGSVKLAPAEPAAVNLASPDRGLKIQGLLGSDLLKKFGHITVDYSGHALRLPAS